MHLFHFFLSQMEEQQLRGKVFRFWPLLFEAVPLHRQVPLADRVVFRGGGKHGLVSGVPLNRGDGSCVVFEGADGSSVLKNEFGLF